MGKPAKKPPPAKPAPKTKGEAAAEAPKAQLATVSEIDLTELREDKRNANAGTERGHAMLERSVSRLGAGRSLVVDRNNETVAGNKTREALIAAGITKAVVVETDGTTPVVVRRRDFDLSKRGNIAREYAYADNRVGEIDLAWDRDQLSADRDDGFDFSALFSEKELDKLLEETSGSDVAGATLVERFVVPPFSVLDARQGYWQDRKRAWIASGIDSGEGRAENLLKLSEQARQGSSGTSIFDPVLAELAYRWFCPMGGAVLDPFAGGSVRGLVAAAVGLAYTGIDLRPEQVAANEKQVEIFGREMEEAPRWICGDSRDLESLIEEEERFDLIFSCPPYFDLEVYSEDERDLSNAGGYDAFLAAYRDIIAAACARLRDNRFACFVVGDLRDPAGACRNFVADTIAAFRDAGLHLYNEAVLVTSVGSLALRAARIFSKGRKLAKAHQNVLVFWKGELDKIADNMTPIEIELPDATEAEV